MSIREDPLLSSGSGRVKNLRKLFRKKYRNRRGQLVLEGVRLIEDALEGGAALEQAFYSADLFTRPGGAELLAQLQDEGVECFQLRQKLMCELADTQTPQGILAVAQKPAFDESHLQDASLWLIVDQLQDPGNLGTLVRSAAAAGAEGIALTPGTVDPYNPKSLRASAGAIFRIPCVVGRDDAEVEGWLDLLHRQQGLLLAAHPHAERLHFELDLTQQPLAVVVGSEAHGVSERFLDAADRLALIPLARGVESLNAAVAGAVMLYEVVRQRAM